ncbi:hypothetical protein ACE193_05980 [Bernardetia sp. OM2101]|uniref:hypothetical protein n=1 Tax=Bernardetia sp. OM2101 TaxID=3344876 RepID=UPI0035CFDC7D
MKTHFLKISCLVILILVSCKTQHLNLNSDILEGKYVGIEEQNYRVELLLEDNNEFKFWIHKGHASDFTQGKWKTSNDFLILNSKTLDKSDSLMYALSSSSLIVLKDSKWKIKQNKIINLHNKKWKLKKEIKKPNDL